MNSRRRSRIAGEIARFPVQPNACTAVAPAIDVKAIRRVLYTTGKRDLHSFNIKRHLIRARMALTYSTPRRSRVFLNTVDQGCLPFFTICTRAVSDPTIAHGHLVRFLLYAYVHQPTRYRKAHHAPKLNHLSIFMCNGATFPAFLEKRESSCVWTVKGEGRSAINISRHAMFSRYSHECA